MMCLNSLVQPRAESSTAFYSCLLLPSGTCTVFIICGYISVVILLNTLLQIVTTLTLGNEWREKPKIKKTGKQACSGTNQ